MLNENCMTDVVMCRLSLPETKMSRCGVQFLNEQTSNQNLVVKQHECRIHVILFGKQST
jgi:hypothetical protein